MTFEAYFKEIHGVPPFPWQAEAARRLVKGEPIDVVTVPTGCGKTAMIDAAVFAAAQGGARRIFFIIDRRVVVDEAFQRAEKIRAALQRGAGLLGDLAERLGDLQVVLLRGGVFTDDDWVWHPERTTIVLSTVDQIGSRLLHRGYGVSPRMWPLHAGFVGNKALYIVDEAHISKPFIGTVRAAVRYGAEIRLIEMTATPAADAGSSVALTSADRQNERLARRVSASKLVKLVEAPDSEADFAALAVAEATKLLDSAKVIGIVVNRVKAARRIFERLRKDKHQAELLTGRIRPWDRERLMERVLPLVRTGRDRSAATPLFIVATQTIEVGG